MSEPLEQLTNELKIKDELLGFVQEKVAQDQFSGAVLVDFKGQSVLEYATGFANKERQIHNTIDTKFNLGSATKMFTGIAIAQLVQSGGVSFQDTVGKFLPDYPNSTVRDQITIHQLLTHTSGLGSYIDTKYREEFLKAREDLKTIKSVVDLFKSRPLPYKPGEVHYSSDGYELLGVIIEAVSRQSYYDFVRDNIFKTAGMPNTDAYEIDPKNPPLDIAVGYTRRDPKTDQMIEGERHPNFDLNLLKGTAGGAGYSTATDLLTFSQALQQNKLLSSDMTKLVFTPYILEGTKDGQSKYYSYGFQVWDINGHQRIGHPGRFSGVNTRFDIFPKEGYTVIVLANYDPPSAFDIAEEAQRLILK